MCERICFLCVTDFPLFARGDKRVTPLKGHKNGCEACRLLAKNKKQSHM